MSDERWLVLYYNRRHNPLIIKKARERFGAKVTSVVIDLGEIRALDAIRAESLAAGAERALHVDARAEYCDDFLSRAVKANAVYQGKYMLSAALARPLLGKKLVELAKSVGATTIVHGFRGNDQVRVDMAVSALSDLNVVAPLRSFGLEDDEIARYARDDIPDEPGTNNPFSVSDNVWGKSTECGPLEDPWTEPPEGIFTYVTPPGRAPDEAATVTVGFEAGVPTSMDGERASLLEILTRLNELGARHGVGIVDMVEDGMVGMKSRAIYENPGGLCLLEAHRDLERFVAGRHENRFKPLVDLRWAELVYDGLWFDPLMEHLNAFIDSMSQRVTGEVKLRLYKGSISVLARRSEQSLYRGDESIYHFGHDFGASDAEAFGRVHNLHTKAAARRRSKAIDMSINHLLMCKPTYFDVAYSINPWMRLDNPVDKDLAARQWDHLHDVLRRLDVRIDLIDPVPGLLDMTFSGDCGMVVGKKFLRSNFRHPERQGEAQHYADWMAAHGYEVLRMPERIIFEGLGDVVYHDNDILFGYGPRSDPEAAPEIRRLFPDLHVRGEVFIRDDRFFHVALAAAFLTKDVMLYYPPAFDEKSQALIAETFPRAIAVDEVDATEYFICNNIVIGDKVLLDNCSPESEKKIRAQGFEPIKCDMSEYKKSGGSLRCLVLKL